MTPLPRLRFQLTRALTEATDSACQHFLEACLITDEQEAEMLFAFAQWWADRAWSYHAQLVALRLEDRT